MKDHVLKQVSFVRTTLIGGVFFLLPLSVIAYLVGQAGAAAYAVYPSLPTLGVVTYTLIAASVLVAIVAACFIAGVFARRSLARRLIRYVEKYLLMLFPRYAIFREQLSGNIGGEVAKNRLRPVLVQMAQHRRLALEVDRDDAMVVVFLPGSPDPWSGEVVLMDPAAVQQVDVPFADLLGVMETLGTGLLPMLRNR